MHQATPSDESPAGKTIEQDDWRRRDSSSLLPQVDDTADEMPAVPAAPVPVWEISMPEAPMAKPDAEAEWTKVEVKDSSPEAATASEEPEAHALEPPAAEVTSPEPSPDLPKAEEEPEVESEQLLAKFAAMQAAARTHATVALCQAKAAGNMAATKAIDVAKDPSVQATAAGAASGAVLLGAGCATTGMTAGGVVGAAVGVVPAVFTFGLSIPFCAAIGGGAGFFCGAAVGSTTGAITGGAAGYGVYARRNQLRSRAEQTLAKVSSGADFVKTRANAATAFFSERAAVARARLVAGGGTGGTEALD